MTGDCHVPFCGSLGVRFPRATRLRSGGGLKLSGGLAPITALVCGARMAMGVRRLANQRPPQRSPSQIEPPQPPKQNDTRPKAAPQTPAKDTRPKVPELPEKHPWVAG
jgi:hypothetical protein